MYKIIGFLLFIIIAICCSYLYFSDKKSPLKEKNKTDDWSYFSPFAINTPTLLNDKFYLCDEQGNALSLIEKEGKITVDTWYAHLSENIFESPCVNDGKRWFVADNDGYIYANSPDTCLWKYQTQAKITAPITISNNILYVGSYDQFLYAIKIDSGELKWKSPTQGFINSKVVIDHKKDALFFGNCDGFLRKINLQSGACTDSIDLKTHLPTAPYLNNDLLYICTYQGTLFCIEMHPLKIRWQTQLKGGFTQEITINDHQLYLVNEEGSLFIINKINGGIIKETKEAYKLLTPLILNKQPLIFNKYGDYHYGNQKGHIDGIFSKSPTLYKDGFMIIDENGGLFYRTLNTKKKGFTND